MRTCRIVNFVVPADHRAKLKESEKKDKYLDFIRELKKPWHLKVTIISIVIFSVIKGLVQGLEDLEITLEETCCHSNSRERPSTNADVKKSSGIK